ncbi:MFS general substrate transporter [Thelephora ganbajun]|uniref:MFS general substrate transporter n=1 Tax=Thelephora ganbajun TaxID=370292 RepID=A0ACB6ZBY2_THEGA|nr:MFS general substrate transporter [Thelephora ganbajun]
MTSNTSRTTLQGDASFLEKQSQVQSSASSTVERVSYKVRFSHIDERKVMRKIDLRVIPVLTLLYLLAFLDRVNISNAAIFGLKEELHLHGTAYNTALVIFFVPYVLFEIPSNFLLKKFSPSVWLSIMMFGFGFVTIMQGVTRQLSGLLACRFFLGVFEATIFPGCSYLIAMWYKRDEIQKRYTFFFASSSLAGAFGGLLATAIGKMNGISHYSAWRWIFILEGILTCVVGFAMRWLIADFPETVAWLTEEEKAFVKARLEDDVGDSGHARKHSFKDIIKVFKDYRVIAGGFMYLGFVVPAYSYAYFAPTIIRSFGYSPVRTQLFSVPPWAVSFVFAMTIATFSDLTKHRFLFVILPLFVALSGFATLLGSMHSHKTQYGALFLAVSGVYSAMPVIVCWFNSNLAGHLRRSIGTGWQIGFGNLGGFVATFTFLSQASSFKNGYSVCIGFICLSFLANIVYFTGLVLENRRRDNSNEGASIPESEKQLMGDLNPDYRYML